jgi:hypothetical protein
MINLLLAIYLVAFGTCITISTGSNPFELFAGLLVTFGGLLIAHAECDDYVRREEWEDMYLANARARLMEMEHEWR